MTVDLPELGDTVWFCVGNSSVAHAMVVTKPPKNNWDSVWGTSLNDGKTYKVKWLEDAQPTELSCLKNRWHVLDMEIDEKTVIRDRIAARIEKLKGE